MADLDKLIWSIVDIRWFVVDLLWCRSTVVRVGWPSSLHTDESLWLGDLQRKSINQSINQSMTGWNRIYYRAELESTPNPVAGRASFGFHRLRRHRLTTTTTTNRRDAVLWRGELHWQMLFKFVISTVQARWLADLPSGSAKRRSSPVSKSHLVPYRKEEELTFSWMKEYSHCCIALVKDFRCQ